MSHFEPEALYVLLCQNLTWFDLHVSVKLLQLNVVEAHSCFLQQFIHLHRVFLLLKKTGGNDCIQGDWSVLLLHLHQVLSQL